MADMALPLPQIASFLGHEIRNSLASLTSGINVLERAGDRPVGIPIVPMMRARLREAGFRMDDLSEFHKLMLGTAAAEQSGITIESLLKKSAEVFLAMSSPEQIQRFEFEISPELNEEVQVDEKHLTMALVNLLLFAAGKLRAKPPLAFSASPAGDRDVQIELRGAYANANPPETDKSTGQVYVEAQPSLAWTSALLKQGEAVLSVRLDRENSKFTAAVTVLAARQ